MSIDKPYTIHEFNRMSKKLKYVALSRSSMYEYINNIYLTSSLTLMQSKLANGKLVKDNTYQLGISVGLP
jgi:hypothetical protein